MVRVVYHPLWHKKKIYAAMQKERKDMNLKGRNFLKLMDFTPEEITYMIDLAADLKAKKKQGIPHDSLTGNIIIGFL